MNFIIEKKQWNILKARFSRARFHVLLEGKDWASLSDTMEIINGKMCLTLASQMISVEPFFRLDLETQRNE